jgi:xylitol oxidase
MTPRHNWADNYTFKAVHIHRPTSVEELRGLVAASPRIRAVGTRHSFNGIADSSGDLVDLSGLGPDLVINREQRTVTVGASTTYAVLARQLQAQGWALHNMASIAQISVAGATATGTHGSGSMSGSLSTAVAGLELVTAAGDVIQVRRGDATFDGVVVGLGAFGIVTRVTLDIQPSFDVRQDAFVDLPWEIVLSNLDEVMSAADSVSLMTLWSSATVNHVWFKTRVADGAPSDVTAAHLGATAAPSASVIVNDDVANQLNPFGIEGPWSERMTHFRLDAEVGPAEQLQSEYLVPRRQAVSAIAKLSAIGDRIDPHLYISEIRTVAQDALWLSPTYGHDCVAIHFTWKRKPDEVHAITHEIEEMLLPLGARPHWAKLIHARAVRLAPLYPRLPMFCDLARYYDPTEKFRNEFLNAHVFGEPASVAVP